MADEKKRTVPLTSPIPQSPLRGSWFSHALNHGSLRREKYVAISHRFRHLLLVPALGLAAWAQATPQALPLLTRADQIRQLSPEEAARGYPAQIRGVITDDVPAPDFFIQDASGGIYVEGSASPRFAHHFGDLVELEGVTGPGKFAPVIREQRVHVLGKGTLPATRVYAFSELAGGQQDSQWAGIRGIVRSVSIDRTSWRETVLAMTVASGGGRFTVRVPIARDQDFSSWVDSEVLIEGVCGSLFNTHRQLIGVLFYVPDLRLIKIEMQAKEVPFSSLMRFSPGGGAQHRVRVQGVVSYQQPGRTLFLYHHGQGLRVLTQQATKLAVGDVVDVVGFPAVGASAPVLEDAVFHRVGAGSPPEPIPLDLTIPWEQYDGALITTDATLLQLETQSDGQHLLLQQNERIFEATLEPHSPLDPLPASRVNSKLRITGICLVSNGGLWSIPQSFRILLRSAQDVTVLQAPPWWNLRRALWLVGIMGGVLLVVLAGMFLLGRKVREQMVTIRQKLQHGAVLEERNRIARELHDTLEQELAGITMQLDLAVDCFRQAPPVAFRALDAARNMSRHSMVEARRSVWDLRCDLLERGDLPSALGQIVRPLVAGDTAKIDVNVSGTPVRLPGRIEMNLLRIGQEAVANAIKHGHASNIHIELQYSPEKTILRVSDDGRGFRPDHADSAGHFGMLDMRERAESLGSHLQIGSAPGRGASITVEVCREQQPISDAELKTHTHSGRG
jgi:signal transduction histidine kinase